MRLASSGGRRLSAAALASRACVVENEHVVTRKELAEIGRNAMKALKLRPSLRQVLAELVGCWGEKMVGGRVLVWPSNDYLMRRTGLSERAVRYGIRGLVEAQLVTPKDSANGKRFAIKDDGRVIEAFGFDLAPLLARAGEWTALIAAQDVQSEKMRRMFDEITIARRAIEEALDALRVHYPLVRRNDIEDELQSLKERVPTRRANASERLVAELRDALGALRNKAEQLFYEAASAGNSCPHIETTKGTPQIGILSEPPKEAGTGEIPSIRSGSVQLVIEACPALLEYPKPIKDEVDLVEAGRYLRGSLGASQHAWDEMSREIGPVRAAIVVAITLQLHTDDVLMGKNQIKNPGGYLRALGRLVAGGRMNLQTELLVMRRRRLS